MLDIDFNYFVENANKQWLLNVIFSYTLERYLWRIVFIFII